MTDEPQPVDAPVEPTPPQPIVVECAVCGDALQHPGPRWVHTNQPADGHKPQPQERTRT